MASSKRERELARMRAERQAARRAAAEARRRTRRNTILAGVAGLAVVAAVVGITLATGGDDTKKDSLSPAAPTPSVVAGTATCSYPKSPDAAAKSVGTPATKGVNNTQPVKIALTTNQGEIDLTLNAAKAPCTTNSFRFLTSKAYYDSTPCHRLTTSGIYVLQCGDPTGKGSGGPGYQYADENLTGATYPRGTLAMANAGPGTNGSQFFLVYKDTQLPPSYTPFGIITKGLDVIDKIAKAGANSPSGDGKPKIAVSITKAAIVA